MANISYTPEGEYLSRLFGEAPIVNPIPTIDPYEQLRKQMELQSQMNAPIALLQAAQPFFQATKEKTGIGQRMAQGLLGGGQQYVQGLNQNNQNVMNLAKLQDEAQKRELQKTQIDLAKQTIKEKEAQLKKEDEFLSSLPSMLQTPTGQKKQTGMVNTPAGLATQDEAIRALQTILNNNSYEQDTLKQFTPQIINQTIADTLSPIQNLMLNKGTKEQRLEAAKEIFKASQPPKTIDEAIAKADALGDTVAVNRLIEIKKAIEKEKTPKNPTYMVNAKGKTVAIDPNLTTEQLNAKIEKEGLKTVPQTTASIYADMRSLVPNATTGAYFDKSTRQWKMPTQQGDMVLTGEQVKQLNVDLRQEKAEAAQRGGSQTANVDAANKLYNENLPEIIALREKVAKKGLLPDTQFKDLNGVKQWIGMKTSDPDVVELQGKVKLMADNLQKTLGGSQGGEWAFKVADTLLDPSYQADAFKRRMESHGKDLKRLATIRKSFGKDNTPIKADPLGIR
jgi:hypothetical protein